MGVMITSDGDRMPCDVCSDECKQQYLDNIDSVNEQEKQILLNAIILYFIIVIVGSIICYFIK